MIIIYKEMYAYVELSYQYHSMRKKNGLKQGRLHGGRSGQIFEIFEILGGAGDINISISMRNY